MNVLDLIDDTDNKSGQTVGSTGQSNPTDFTFISPYKRDGGMSPDKQFLAQSLGGVLNKVSYIGANKVFADRVSSQIQASQPANQNKTGLLDVAKAVASVVLNKPDSTLENIVEVADPTGMSSWDDVLKSAINTGMSGETALEVAGAIPFLGKAKKAGQLIDIVSKGLPVTARQARNLKASVGALKAVGNYGPNAGRATDAVQAVTQYNEQNKGAKSSNPKASNIIASGDLTNPSTNNAAMANYVGKDFEKFVKRQYDDKINQYFIDFVKNSNEKISKEDVDGIKKDFIDYINSPEYAKRQAMNPDVFQSSNPVDEKFQQDFAEFAAKSKRDKRGDLVRNVASNIVSGDKFVGDFTPLQGTAGSLNLSEKLPLSVLAHEAGHSNIYYSIPLTEEQKSLMAKNNGILPAEDRRYMPEAESSDIVNSSEYYKTTKGRSLTDVAKDVSPFLNQKEVDKFIKLAKPMYTSDIAKAIQSDSVFLPQSKWANDPHYDKDSLRPAEFANEQYGDLMGVRKLLLKNGITKSFGEDLDDEKMQKAINNTEITKDPLFRRFYRRYGKDNIIELNNTIAMEVPVKTSKIQTA